MSVAEPYSDFDDVDSGIGVKPPHARPDSLYGQVETRLMSLAEDGKSELVRNFDGLVTMVQELAIKVDGAGGGMVGGYAHQAADMLGDLQARLRDKPVAELLDEGRDLVRRSPTLAVGLAIVAGFAAARLVKASGSPA